MIQVENFTPKQLIVVFAGYLIVGVLPKGWAENKSMFTEQLPVGVDIYSRWVGSRVVWEGQAPYSRAIELEAQQLIFGGSVQIWWYLPQIWVLMLDAFLFTRRPAHQSTTKRQSVS